MEYFFEGTDLTNKKATKHIGIGVKAKCVKSKDDISAVLIPTLFSSTSNFLLCTDDDIFYITNSMLRQFDKYPYSSISAVVQESPISIHHYIAITIGGGEKVIFEINTKKEDAMKMADFIRNKLVSNIAVPAATAISPSVELRNFKELLDMGAITEEEYNLKKKQLLGL